MNDRRPLIVTGLVLLLIIALIGGVIFYLVNFIRSRQENTPATSDIFPRSSASIIVSNPNASPTAFPTGSSAPGQTAQTPTTGVNGNSKFIMASNLQVNFPNTWGLLTCSNSQNFELDPYSNSDVTINCFKATKPVTFVVAKNSCVGGQVITLGNTKVRKVVDANYVTATGHGTQTHWCTQTTPSLDITNRVGNGTAFGADNFSATVEQIISNLTPIAGS